VESIVTEKTVNVLWSVNAVTPAVGDCESIIGGSGVAVLMSNKAGVLVVPPQSFADIST